jgi:subtilisin
MAQAARKSVIITFKAKDKRPDKKKDKIEIVNAEISSKVSFFDADAMSLGAHLSPSLSQEDIGFDINQYSAPIVTASLTDKEINELAKNPNIETVEDDGLMYALNVGPRVETLLVEGQPSVLAETIPAGVAQIKAPSAWDCSRGKGIRVAVLDTGIDGAHPDLAANFKGGISFVPGQTADGHGHGTHCAGTIGAAINGAGVVGVAPAASLYAVKVLADNGSGNWSWLIAGINWCITNKMHILSMSLGGGSAPTALESMCNTAFNSGLLLIAAAGNAGPPVPPATSTVGVPGRYKNVIAVSAINSANVIAPFSSRGSEVEICAPGVNVLSTLKGGGYGTMSGTSMACPHVSGAAAVVWGSHRFATNVQIWNLLGSTADNLGVPGWDALYGYGRVDVDQAAAELVVPPAVGLRAAATGS